jgi:uncharacterized protein
MINGLILSLVSGLSIGALGSFHCIGMCGPLALSLPTQHLNSFDKNLAIVLYNFGRIMTYILLGIFFGLIGMTFSWFKVQQFLSIGVGLAILLLLVPYSFSKPDSLINNYTQTIKMRLSSYLHSERNAFSFFKIGLLNGLLPCGLVYVAIAASITSGSFYNSGLLMLGFGLGTFPIMALTMYFGKFVSLSVRKNINKATPYFVACIAILLIMRGLDLGIPYLSPSLENGKMSCCHK